MKEDTATADTITDSFTSQDISVSFYHKNFIVYFLPVPHLYWLTEFRIHNSPCLKKFRLGGEGESD